MSITPLYPFAGDNAIQNVVFALEWPEQLTTQQLLVVRGLHEEGDFRKTFPKVQEQQMMVLTVTSDMGQPPKQLQQQQLGGINFTRPSLTNVGTVAKALNVSRNNCLAVVSEYGRWTNVWGEVREWLLKVANIVLPTKAIYTIGLQYTDVFQWRANPESLVLSDVFSTESRLLPAHAFDTSSIWHSHHGYIEKHQQPVPYDLLDNVNVNVVENSGQRSIQILTSHRATLTNPIWTVEQLTEVLDRLMADLHQKNKTILSDLLTRPVRALIKMEE